MMDLQPEEEKICGEMWREMICNLPPHTSALHRDSIEMDREVDHRQPNYD